VRTEKVFDRPVPRGRIQELPSMTDYRLFSGGWGPVGTNFRISPRQAGEINRVLETEGYGGPSLEGVEEHPDTPRTPQIDRAQRLHAAGPTVLFAQLHSQYWQLEVDAIVILTDASLNLWGEQAPQIQEALGDDLEALLQQARQQLEFPPQIQQQKTDDLLSPPFDPRNPILVERVGEDTDAGSLKYVIFSPLVVDPDSQLAGAGEAAVAVVQLAAERSLRSLAMPSLGASEASVVQAMVEALILGAPFAPMQEIVLAVDDLALVEAAKQQSASMVSEPLPPTAPDRAVFDNDSPAGARIEDDKLNFRRQVESLAKLVAARDVVLPISIGLFGNWGVGKTYFMNMMRGEVHRLASRQDQSNQKATFMRRVAQIEFNAWHYVDTNLWASLAVRIFDGLAQAIVKKGDDVQLVRRRLRADLESSSQTKKQALERQRQAEQQRQSAALKLETLEAQRARRAAEYDNLRLSRLLQDERWQGRLSTVVAIAQEFGLELPTPEGAADDPAIVASLATVEQARDLWQDFQGLNGRFQGLLFALSNRFSTLPKGLATLTMVALFLWVVGLLGPLGNLIREQSELLGRLWPEVFDRVVQAAALIGSTLAWARDKQNKLSQGLGILETLQQELARPEIPEPGEQELSEEQRQQLEKEQELRRKVEGLNAQIETAQQEAREAERRIAQAQAELQRINAGGLVYDFLASRTADPRYRESLGLISTIREDFRQLEHLLADWHQNYDEKIKPDQADNGRSESRPPIERIILYIDDLDRCHPDKVVEVLQAVHLILAFPLFVVVVAVDPRWLERSLYKAYAPDLMKAQARTDDDFSPQNYLEKIFQIPFSVPAMARGGFEDLIDHLITTRSEQAAETVDEELTTTAGRIKDGEDDLKAKSDPDSDDEKTKDLEIVSVEDKTLEKDDDAVDETDDQQKEIEEHTSPEGPPPLEDWEQSLLQCLYPFIRTPRLAKRMLNIYRLLRVRAGHSDMDFGRFADQHQGEYRAAQLLLAMNIGYPRITGRVLHLLRDSSIDLGWDAFLKVLDPASTSTSRLVWVTNLNLRLAEQEEYQVMVEALDAFKSRLAQNDPPLTLPDDLAPFRRWAPEVGRYSFHWHLEEA